MLIETENASVVHANSLENTVAVQQSVVEDRNLRLFRRNVFAIQINLHNLVLNYASTYSKILPSAISNTRSPRVAICWSCVTITSVVPESSRKRQSKSRIDSPVFESRLPVGSSANT